DGHYDIRWRVVSSDGHPISGVIPFSVGDAGERPAQESVPPPQAEEAETESSSASPALTRPARTAHVAVGGAAAALLLVWVIGRVRRRS
uniref:copper resistance protein CopC n=1 Tax=Pseudactinotalea sp. TaxID=1926260 RepID=UPI003B39FD74